MAGTTTRSRGCCCSTRACGPIIRRCARRTSASGRPGPGARSPTKCARSPAASPRWASGAAMHLAIIGDNRPRLYWSMARRAVPRRRAGADVPGRAVAEEMVRAQRRRDRLRRRRGPGAGRQAARGRGRRCRRSRTSIYDDPRGLRNYERPCTTLRAAAGDGPRVRRARTPASSTPRSPRAAPTTSRSCSTRRAPRASRRACARRTPRSSPRRGRRASSTSSAPTTASSPTCRWRGSATTCSPTRSALVAGFTINCPESGDTVMTDLREIGPTYYFAPPRVFENLLTQVMIRMEDASALEARDVPLLHGGGAPLRRRDPRRQAGRRRGDRLLLRARQSARLRAAAQRARHEPHPRRLHRRRGDRARTCSASTARSAST